MKNKKTKYIILIILGITAIIASLFFYMNGWVAIGGGLIGFGTASLLLSLIKLLSKPELQKANEIEEKDERNMAIRGKAAYTSNMIMLVCLCAACIFYMHIDQFITAMVFFGLLIILEASLLIATAVYGRKM